MCRGCPGEPFCHRTCPYPIPSPPVALSIYAHAIFSLVVAAEYTYHQDALCSNPRFSVLPLHHHPNLRNPYPPTGPPSTSPPSNDGHGDSDEGFPGHSNSDSNGPNWPNGLDSVSSSLSSNPWTSPPEIASFGLDVADWKVSLGCFDIS